MILKRHNKVGGFPDSRAVYSIAPNCSTPLSTARVQIYCKESEKVASDLGWGSCFLRYSVFPPYQQMASYNLALTLPMLRLLPSKAQERKDFLKPSKPCHVGIHWIAFADYSQMGTQVPGFLSFFSFLVHFVLAKLATSSIRVNMAENVIINKFQNTSLREK